MALHNWCLDCDVPSKNCKEVEAHKKKVRPDGSPTFQWRTDFYLGGRGHARIRKYFRTKEEAQAFESHQRSDYLRGKLMPMEMQSKIAFRQLADEWYNKHALIRIKNPRAEKYHLEALCSFFKDRPINSLKNENGEQFIQYSIKNGKSPGGVNRDIHTLSSMMNWAVKNGYLLVNPFAHLEQMKGDIHRVRWLTRDEFNKLIETCQRVDPPLADVTAFGVLTGFRKGNLERVTAQDINGDFLTASKTKSGKPYDVPISTDLRGLLGRLANEKPSGPLLDTVNLSKRFRVVVQEAGLWKGARHPETVSLHTLRHTFASWYLKNGGDLFKLSKMLGHSSIVITQRYAHLCQQEMAQQASLLNFGITYY